MRPGRRRFAGPSPVQRNKRQAAKTVKTVKDGTMPLRWEPRKRAQNDVDAKWTKKQHKNHFGYKLHASVGKCCKLIRKFAITNAAVVGTTVFEGLLDLSNTIRNVYADRGYPGIEREARLK